MIRMFRQLTLLALLAASAATAENVPDWLEGIEVTTEDQQSADPEASSSAVDRPADAGYQVGPFIEEYVIGPGDRYETVDERADSTGSTETVQPPIPSSPVAQEAPSVGSRYGVQPSDLLKVSVWREPELEREVAVSPDGWISYPLLGELHVEGLTVAEIQLEIESRLASFMAEPAVSVSLLQTFGNRVYVVGKVNKPGVYSFSKDLDVVQALTLAGGTSKFADANSIKVLRRGEMGQITYEFDYSKVQKGRRLEQNILLQSGDVVMVP